jgi:hypothetical protein
LDDTHKLHYRHEGTWAVCAISQAPDVTLYEAMNFLDGFKEAFVPKSSAESDKDDLETRSYIEEIQQEEAAAHFKKFKGKVSELITQWNKNPQNRDQTYHVFQQLLQTKDEMIKNMHLLNERDQLLEVGLVKAQGLEKSAKTYKQNARKTKKKMGGRRCCLWSSIIAGILVFGVGVFLILWLWLKVI